MIMDFIVKHAGTIGFMIFFLFFLAMVLWVFRPGAKKFYQKDATIPLSGDE